MHVMTRNEWPLLQSLVFLCAGFLHVRTPAPPVGSAPVSSPAARPWLGLPRAAPS